MIERYTRDGLVFDVSDRGPSDGRVAIALHGFPEDRASWAGLAEALAPSGVRVLAPDQRGYSPGAVPDGRRAYVADELVADVLALADEAGADRFDVIGHDWGALVAWAVAAAAPERVRTLTALSVPHPRAVVDALGRSTQLLHSWYMLAFQVPVLPERLLGAGGGRALRRALVRTGLDEQTAARYASRATRPGGLRGPVNWYRALPLQARRPLGPVSVPTLFAWGDHDGFITRVAAHRCGNYVTGPYTFEIVVGGSHWFPFDAPVDTAALVLELFASAAD
ncbi:MAG TPA: alpha/beta fold hydrolase [Acidimicrobiales bacterium]|nr:alpha/beta fold hydrolase [Acidimicrobiales bacterium]